MAVKSKPKPKKAIWRGRKPKMSLSFSGYSFTSLAKMMNIVYKPCRVRARIRKLAASSTWWWRMADVNVRDDQKWPLEVKRNSLIRAIQNMHHKVAGVRGVI